MTVYDTMAFGLKMARVPKAEIDQKVRRAADMLQLSPVLDRLPKQLSGDQRQCAAIGRAITRDPKLVLFDEPLSNLDAALRVATRIEIVGLTARKPEATMIFVTHDQVEAMRLASRIVVLNAGRIEQVGTPLELYHTPANRFVAGFIGSPAMNSSMSSPMPTRCGRHRATWFCPAPLTLPFRAFAPRSGPASGRSGLAARRCRDCRNPWASW